MTTGPLVSTSGPLVPALAPSVAADVAPSLPDSAWGSVVGSGGSPPVEEDSLCAVTVDAEVVEVEPAVAGALPPLGTLSDDGGPDAPLLVGATLGATVAWDVVAAVVPDIPGDTETSVVLPVPFEDWEHAVIATKPPTKMIEFLIRVTRFWQLVAVAPRHANWHGIPGPRVASLPAMHSWKRFCPKNNIRQTEAARAPLSPGGLTPR